MKLKKIIQGTFLTATFAILLVSCSNPINKEYSEATFQNDIKEIKEKGELDTLTINILVNYINSRDLIKGTYQEILVKAQEQKRKEQEMCDIVDQFLTEINNNTKKLTRNNITANFDSTFSKFSFYVSKDWKLEAKQENDSLFTVESTSKTHNSFGKPIEIIQRFALTNQYGNWQIFDSYGLMALHLDFDIVDVDWDFYPDRAKYEILSHLQESIKLEIVKKGNKSYFGDAVQGELRLINNSKYDVKGVKILIEHFDDQGKSVNTDYERVYKIIRKNGYLEFNWYTSDCSKCSKQQFKINFIREY